MIDSIDKRILRALQRDSTQTNAQLAEHVGLSATPCSRRVNLLEKQGVITGYIAQVKPCAVDLRFSTFVRITLTRHDKASLERFANAMQQAPEVLECHLMAGTYDYLLRVIARDLEDYQRFQMETLTKIEGLGNVVTEIPLRTIKQTNQLPI
ncbi:MULTISPECIES: Lrp/AsnC family transcriptional regulator [unclassified Pseudomonas]|uniref:Lrp/AsnC family transcriptional regulator n=1 Tax=unclassified Pseudomonas TaxID=196821 RepID=UPI00095C3BD4|nr:MULTISPECIES: Lrp/AsnC family transcriptional regulator [unclassified Pseudomonas]OLU20720.1 AsnC family transcriptional regulator [Pseudomonas sp. PA1(2017)]OLU24287.1 AsnC family transcriptional regulator [Pseudomonas sp. PA27(2017)]